MLHPVSGFAKKVWSVTHFRRYCSSTSIIFLVWMCFLGTWLILYSLGSLFQP